MPVLQQQPCGSFRRISHLRTSSFPLSARTPVLSQEFTLTLPVLPSLKVRSPEAILSFSPPTVTSPPQATRTVSKDQEQALALLTASFSITSAQARYRRAVGTSVLTPRIPSVWTALLCF